MGNGGDDERVSDEKVCDGRKYSKSLCRDRVCDDHLTTGDAPPLHTSPNTSNCPPRLREENCRWLFSTYEQPIKRSNAARGPHCFDREVTVMGKTSGFTPIPLPLPSSTKKEMA